MAVAFILTGVVGLIMGQSFMDAFFPDKDRRLRQAEEEARRLLGLGQ